MSILRLVRNFALLAVLALAAHTAAGADKQGHPHCGGFCDPHFASFCHKDCVCAGIGVCVPKGRG